MKSTGRHSENSGYLVIMLLVVGLTAFSHSMKGLTEIHQFTMDASRLVAQWSGNVTPAEIPHTIIKIEKLESCESKQSAPSVELPWLSETSTVRSAVAPVRTRQIKIQRVTPPAITIPNEAAIARLKKLNRLDVDADEFEVRIPSVQFPETGGAELPEFTFKTKARRHGATKFSPRDREMILKTLNRSINLRIAS